ncbi:hypothetical protein K7432_003413 [Basidiobolus ranarum]|uniref:C2 domain-containing protein n=1 Tax=Basidiobolus ranarum TaxID=34480 RepID=A0ABR2WZZ9_9FUNG
MSTQVPPLFMLMHKGKRKPKKHLGVLEIKPCQGRGLRVVQKIGKQDPYILVEYGVRNQRTKADKNGGQKPCWEDVFKFDVFEEDTVLRVQCLDQNLRDSSLIGQRTIDFSPVLQSYQWDGWFGLTSQGLPAGDIYFEFTFHPGNNAPKPPNLPKPAVHRITLTPKEILYQMKESEDALPPLENTSQNMESETVSEKEPPKEMSKLPDSEVPLGTIRSEIGNTQRSSHTPHTIKHENIQNFYANSNSSLYEKHPRHPRVSEMHSFVHRNSEPIILNSHFYSPPKSSVPIKSFPENSLDKPTKRIDDWSSPKPEAPRQNSPVPSVTDRRRSRLIGPRRANSTPELPRREMSTPSSSNLAFETTPSPLGQRQSFSYLPEVFTHHIY